MALWDDLIRVCCKVSFRVVPLAVVADSLIGYLGVRSPLAPRSWEGETMKHWLFLALTCLLLLASGLIGIRFYALRASPPPQPALKTLAKSLYKYDMCVQAYAFANADDSNPYKTDYSFPDPVRKAQDTLTPHLLDYNPQTRTANFLVDVAIPQVNTYHLALKDVHEEDGVFVLLPDQENHLRRTQIPQFIVASLLYGRLAIVNYTCPQKWSWSATKT